jgi:hypothetical protein
MADPKKATLAFGPKRPGIGSWEWLGEDLAQELERYYHITSFTDCVPDCDAVVLIKELLSHEQLEQITDTRAVIYCPVDCYGSAAELDRDGLRLRLCDRIVLHCECLRKYFQSYAPVKALEHHLRFVPETISLKRATTHPMIVWVGHRSHLPLLVDYANHHSLPGRLEVLTNGEEEAGEVWMAADFGFNPRLPIRIQRWTAERHRQAVSEADLAIDLKGSDFRQRHKPSAKALDFLASNLPLAMNVDSRPAQHLRQMGVFVPAPHDHERWLSEEYRRETERFGQQLRETFSRPQVGQEWRRMIDETLTQKQALVGGHNR